MTAQVEKLLTWDQKQTLCQLQLLLRRRCLAGSAAAAQRDEQTRVLLHARDDSIVGSYRLACALHVRREADALLVAFRAALFMSGDCPEAPHPVEDAADQRLTKRERGKQPYETGADGASSSRRHDDHNGR